MPRQARIDYPGFFYHVMIRGLDGKRIFKSNKDRDKFLEILTDVQAVSAGASIVAWSLMPNHVHILIMRNGMSLATFMKKLLTKYALLFNKKYKRKGPLFQGRYKSIVVNEESYYLELIRYIHLNPIHSHSVKSLKELNIYPYTGHATLMGRVDRKFQTVDGVLNNFASTRKQALVKLHDFMLNGINTQKRCDYSGGGIRRSMDLDPSLTLKDRFDERVLGGGDFIERILQESLNKAETVKRPIKLNLIISNTCKDANISLKDLLSGSKSRQITNVRQQICIKSINENGYKVREVATALGVNESSVSRIITKHLVKQ